MVSIPHMFNETPSSAPYTTTFLDVSGSHSIERAPELADAVLKVKVTSADQIEGVRALRSTLADLLHSIKALTPEKQSTTAGSPVDAEWPIKNPMKPVVRYHTAALSTRSWLVSADGSALLTHPSNYDPNDPRVKRLYRAEQMVTVTFHNFSALEVFVTRTMATKNVEVLDVVWRLSKQTRKQLEASGYRGAVLDAKQRALDIFAPLADAQPQLKAVKMRDMRDTRDDSAQGYERPHCGGRLGASSQNQSHDFTLSFEPRPVVYSVLLHVQWAVLQ